MSIDLARLDDFVRGDTWEILLTVTNPVGTDPDLNTFSIWFQVKDKASDVSTVIAKTKGDGIEVQSITNTALATLDPEDTILLDPGRWWEADFQLRDAGGKITSFLVSLKCRQHVTTTTV